MHLDIIEKCYRIFEKKDLINISELEQKLITGVDTDEKTIKPKQVKKELF